MARAPTLSPGIPGATPHGDSFLRSREKHTSAGQGSGFRVWVFGLGVRGSRVQVWAAEFWAQ